MTMSGVKSSIVDETRLPRTTRNLIQRNNEDLMQFNTSQSDLILCIARINGDIFHYLEIQSVSHAEPEQGGTQTLMNLSSCLAICFTNIARVIPLGSSWYLTVLI